MAVKYLKTNLKKYDTEPVFRIRVNGLALNGQCELKNLQEIVRRIHFVPIDSLVPHEKTTEWLLDYMAAKYQSNGYTTRLVQAAPLTDEKRMIVNGQHLASMLKTRFGAKICGVFDEKFHVLPIAAWYPVSSREPAEIVSMTGARAEKCSMQEGKVLLESNQASFLMVRKNGMGNEACFAVFCLDNKGQATLAELVDNQQQIIASLDAQGGIIDFVADAHAMSYAKQGVTLLVRRPFNHKEVKDRVLQKGVFPPKSTRINFSVEPRICIPGEMYYLGAEEANEKLKLITTLAPEIEQWTRF